MAQRGLPRERYVGELYFQAHRGTYTSQARTKRGNRKSELALREAEFWGTAARVLNGFDFTAAEQACPHGLPVGQLMREAGELFA